MLLAGLSLLLAAHSLVMSRTLQSSLLLIVCFCWLWVAAAALLDRLAAARAMAVTMTVILVIAGLVVKTTSVAPANNTAFYSLALFPILTAWICVYVYVRHLQHLDDVSGRPIDTWFEEQELERLDRAEALVAAGHAFTEGMTRTASQDAFVARPRQARRKQPRLKAAS